MFLTIVGILVLLWLLGIGFHIAAGFVHILIIAAIIVLIYDLLTRNRKA